MNDNRYKLNIGWDMKRVVKIGIHAEPKNAAIF